MDCDLIIGLIIAIVAEVSPNSEELQFEHPLQKDFSQVMGNGNGFIISIVAEFCPNVELQFQHPLLRILCSKWENGQHFCFFAFLKSSIFVFALLLFETPEMLSPKKLIMIYTFKLFRSRSPSQQRRIARLSLLQVASGV